MAGRRDHKTQGYCFIFKLLVPTPKVYRVPRVSPEVTASKLFPPTSVAGYAGPSSSLQTTPEVPVLSEVQSGVLHLLGLISGVRRGGKGIPISSLVVEMDLLPALHLNLSTSCLSSPVPARWPALGRRAYTYMCMVCEMCVWCMCG